MTLEVADECTQKEIDVIGLGCSKESFTEHSEVEKLIDELRTSAQHQTNQTDIHQYQEQPHLIDSHLDGLLTKIINIIREEVLDYEVKHVAFRCLYFISKVRGYKVVARHLPHEKYLAGTTKAQEMAFYVLAIYLTRPDVKDSYLPGFINWAHEVCPFVFNLKITVKLTVFISNRLDILETSSCLLEIPAGQQIIIAANLQQSQPVETKAAISVNDEDDHDYDVPEEIEEVLNEILQALRDKNREVQYSAAKGIGRLTSRLSKNFADQPVMDCCCPSDCLLSCLLWSRPCCTMSYAVIFPLARLNTSVDRALFLTASSDHLRLVRLRKNAYLQLSLFVAQYKEYRPHLIQHLVDRKVIHWDTVIRQLTSQALHQMTFLDPESMKLILSTQILPRCTNPELYLRHGSSILASGKVISALCQVAKDHQRRLPDELGDVAMESITQTCIDILEERFWRSFGGDPMRIAVCHFIQDLSSGGFPLLDAVVDRWLKALRDSADSNVQQSAISAVTALIGEYFRHQPVEKLTALSISTSTISYPSLYFIYYYTGGVDQVTLAGIFRTFIDGFEDYTVDSRGDIGAIVRESAMYSIQVKSSSAPFMSYLRQLVAENKLDELNLVTRDILNVFQENLNSVRLMPYIFNFLDHLLSSGCLDSVFKSMSRSLLTLIRTEMTNGGKPFKLLISSVDLYCHLLRGDQVTFAKSIIHLLNLLVNQIPRVRKITATKLYETLLTLTDISPSLANHQDDILAIPSDTD
ncbi:hypothetical protein DAPPUDRAFT_104147 [Daphnia pulex]|uniref:Tubulin-specific chaperone D n=1 Tax=Daphnia pulex TaxID=6669 RepID=E9GLD4_DAPPU|nr:hypothetical protein DAPPUDRAFT_104147 [Daphnia pulex]|eukprot:EFX79711.1 hypothetical protein DAPPUDRAFT_104147 [Daphnia pulex]